MKLSKSNIFSISIMDNSKPVLWDRTHDTVQSTLRQPKGLPKAILNNCSPSNSHSEINTRVDTNQSTIQNSSDYTVKGNSNLEDLVKNSKLKVDAAEWYPSGYYSNSNYVTNNHVEGLTSSVQNRLRINMKYSNASDDLEQSALLDSNEIEYSPDFKRLKQIITTLTKDPGQFHNLLELFLETLTPYYEDIIPISVVVKILVEQAINNANFRYTGARLCWFIEQNCPIFRAELHSECMKQIKVNDNTPNVLLFVAELYTQLPHLTVYGALLIEALKRLFTKGGDQNIKCICQALKLTGYTLEQSNKSDLDVVFNQLWSIKDTVSGSASILLQTVFNLRSSNWGHSSEGSDSDHESDIYPYESQQATVFLNTGEKLTNEESEFIAAHLQSSDDILSDTSDPDELCNPEEEMDQEIQEAFKEFVKYSSSKH